MMKHEILAYHGWGFGADCWQRYRSFFLGDYWHSFDRGYLLKPHLHTPPNSTLDKTQSPAFSTDLWTQKIVVVHSYGLHLCPLDILAQTHVLILLNSFLEFHPSDPILRRKSQRKLDRMIQVFQDQPHRVWQNFLAQTFYPDPIPPELSQELIQSGETLLNSKQLLDDLTEFNALESRLPHLLSIIKLIPNIMIFTSLQDTIVANPIASADVATPTNTVVEIVAEGGHGFPFTHPQFCAQKMIAHLSKWAIA